MTNINELRIRRSVNDLWKDWAEGEKDNLPEKKKPLEDLVKAWKGIQDLAKDDPDHPNGFFKIGGMHGSPFRVSGFDFLLSACFSSAQESLFRFLLQ